MLDVWKIHRTDRRTALQLIETSYGFYVPLKTK